MQGALNLLSPRMRAGIADTLRWRTLRPVQEASIPVILGGENAVVLAPTAGGKTEAALIPALDAVSLDPVTGVRLLYLSPLIALLNNQEARAQQLAGLVGLGAFKWHGGVGASARRRFLDDPDAALLITPESLEAMLLGRRPGLADLFRHLRFVVVDEVHAFAGSDRGAQLSSLLERIVRYASTDVQRIGLSATISNPQEVGAWLRGSSGRPGRVVRPDEPPPTRVARLYWHVSTAESLLCLSQAVQVGKTIVFTESRADAEKIADHLHRTTQLDYVAPYHSALSRDVRQTAEDAMNGAAYPRATLCATSAMELGVDIGDLDDVIQWEPPAHVSSLLQRWGRAGRRAGRVQTTSVYARSTDQLLTAAAQISLAQEGWVEAVRPHRRAFHILVQQMLSEVLHQRHTADSLWAMLGRASAFSGITQAEFGRVMRHLCSADLLIEMGGLLSLGDRAEELFGRRQYGALLTTFETPESYLVVDARNRYELGQLEALFVDELREELASAHAPVVLLAGRPWQVTGIGDEPAVVEVVPDQSGRPPKWAGGAPRLMDTRVAGRHRELLTRHPWPEGLEPEAMQVLEQLREQHQFLSVDGLPVTQVGPELTLHTYAGTRINTTLRAGLSRFGRVTADAFRVTLRVQIELDRQNAIAWLSDPDRIVPQELLGQLAQRYPRLGKYQPYLPGDLASEIVLEMLTDVAGLNRVLLKLSIQHVEA